MTDTRGVRRDTTEEDEILKPGEYGRHWYNHEWYCCPPGHPDLLAGLKSHQVIEHGDGTITVSPSILVRVYHQEQVKDEWHGYLEMGVWREV